MKSDGKWIFIQKKDIKTFTGTEQFESGNSNFTFALPHKSGSSLLCNYSQNGDSKIFWASESCIGFGGSYFGVTSVTELKAKLAALYSAGKPLTVEYEPETSTVRELSIGCQKELNAIQEHLSIKMIIPQSVTKYDTVTDLTFAKAGDICDSLVIEKDKAIYTQRIGKYTVCADDSETWQDLSNGERKIYGLCINGINGQHGIMCNRYPNAEPSDNSPYVTSNEGGVTFYNIPTETASSLAGFKNYIASQSQGGNNLEIMYVKQTPAVTDVSELFSLRGFRLKKDFNAKISASNNSDTADYSSTEVTYSSSSLADMCTLTVNCKKQNGETVRESTSRQIRKGSAFLYVPKEISGYRVISGNVFGKMDTDKSLDIFYEED